jgi:hypothetical protein
MTTAIREREHDPAAVVAVKDWTDRELLTACLQNDNRAWQELMRQYDGPLRGVVYKRLLHSLDRLPSDYRDDVMGAFYLKLIERNMSALRSFNWEKGTALFKWLSFIVVQCAVDYLREALATPEFEPLTSALEVAEEGGVLMSGRGRMTGSLSGRVLAEKARAAAVDAARAKTERRRTRRAARKRKPSA